jgi:hypothetical protein
MISNTIPPLMALDSRALAEAVGAWRDFYAVMGESAATMVGLLFVAATVGSRQFRGSRTTALRMFLTASVVHFTGILVISLIVMAPIGVWGVFGGLVIAAGVFGLGYYALAWGAAVRDGLSKRIDREDTAWYAILPILAYLLESVAGISIVRHLACGLPALAVAAGFLMILGIRNAWDITVWSIMRPPE